MKKTFPSSWVLLSLLSSIYLVACEFEKTKAQKETVKAPAVSDLTPETDDSEDDQATDIALANEELGKNPTLPEESPEIPETAESPDDAAQNSGESNPAPEDDASQSTPTPEELPAVGIKAITAEGNGCPTAESFAVNISDDRKAFTVSFAEFSAQIGPGIDKAERSKKCNVNLDLEVPAGWQYSIANFNHRGFIDLEAGIQAVHTTKYFFHGRGKAGGFKRVERGAVSKDYVFTDKIGLLTGFLSREWSVCKGEKRLTVQTSLELKNLKPKKFPDAQGVITTDTSDGEIKQEFGLIWRRCR